MKQVIDRFQCVWNAGKGMKRKNKKKRTAALIAAGGDPVPIFQNTVSIAKAFATTVGAEWAGELKISDTDGMNEIPENIAAEARRFVHAVLSKHSGA